VSFYHSKCGLPEDTSPDDTHLNGTVIPDNTNYGEKTTSSKAAVTSEPTNKLLQGSKRKEMLCNNDLHANKKQKKSCNEELNDVMEDESWMDDEKGDWDFDCGTKNKDCIDDMDGSFTAGF
jgi:hypothetical protein